MVERRSRPRAPALSREQEVLAEGLGVAEGRSSATRERVIEVVIALLEEGGEAAVRIEEVRQRSGVSIGSLYHHFTDRDGLIAAGQLRRFARFAEAEIAALSDIVREAADLEAFRTALRTLTLHTSSHLRTSTRWGRVAVLASTLGREELAGDVRAIQTRLTDELQAHVAQGQARGFFRSDLDARAIGTFVEAYSLGRVLNDVDERAVDDAEWERVVWVVIDALLAG